MGLRVVRESLCAGVEEVLMSGYNQISGSDKVPEQTKNEFLKSITKKIKHEEKEYSECVECGMPIAKGSFMCDECYWRLREGC